MVERGAIELSPTARIAVGRYELFAKLGSGGQADVFLAIARGLGGFNKLSVVKRLKAGEGDDPLLVDMFLDEARLAARLAHPNIVHTYEVGEANGSYFIAMEYLEGQPLSKLARSTHVQSRATPVPNATWAAIVIDALTGLDYAHDLADYDGRALEIVHRDVSPQNLFVTYDGTSKVVDFGVAKAVTNNVKTETGAFKGKISYMAPDQVRGGCDRRADLFSMGVVLWELVAGRRLFDRDPVHVLHRLMTETDPLPCLTTVRPDVEPALAAIVARALERDPDRRYATADEMRAALEEFRAGAGADGTTEAVRDLMAGAFGPHRASIRRRVQEAITATSLGTLRASNATILDAPSSIVSPAPAPTTPSTAPVTIGLREDLSTPNVELATLRDRTPPPMDARRMRLAAIASTALTVIAIVGAWRYGAGGRDAATTRPPPPTAGIVAPPLAALPAVVSAATSTEAPPATAAAPVDPPSTAPVAPVAPSTWGTAGAPATSPANASRARGMRPARAGTKGASVRVIDDDRAQGIAIIGD